MGQSPFPWAQPRPPSLSPARGTQQPSAFPPRGPLLRTGPLALQPASRAFPLRLPGPTGQFLPFPPTAIFAHAPLFRFRRARPLPCGPSCPSRSVKRPTAGPPASAPCARNTDTGRPAPISDPPGSRLRDSARAVISAGLHTEDRSRPYLSVVRDPSPESHLQRRPQTLPVPPNPLRRSRAPRRHGPVALPHLRVPRAVQQLRTVSRDFSELAAADPDTCNNHLRVSSVDPAAGSRRQRPARPPYVKSKPR
jgi:hypothetical protein